MVAKSHKHLSKGKFSNMTEAWSNKQTKKQQDCVLFLASWGLKSEATSSQNKCFPSLSEFPHPYTLLQVSIQFVGAILTSVDLCQFTFKMASFEGKRFMVNSKNETVWGKLQLLFWRDSL